MRTRGEGEGTSRRSPATMATGGSGAGATAVAASAGAALDASGSFESIETPASTAPPELVAVFGVAVLFGVEELHPTHTASAAAGTIIHAERVDI